MFSSSSGGAFPTSCSFICTSAQTSTRQPHQPSLSSSSTYQFGANVNVAIEVTTTRTNPEEIKNRNYKLKCCKMQKHIRELVFLNGSLQAELNECCQRLEQAIEERRFLLNKVLSFQKDVYQEASSRILHQALSKRQLSKPPAASCLSPSQRSTSPSVTVSGPPQGTTKRRKLSDSQVVTKISKQATLSTNEVTPKKLIQQISLDSNGKPIFPIVIGGLTVHSLGEVISDRPPFHNQDYIFPVGYCSSRTYASLRNPKIKCLYTCKITDVDDAPNFEIVPEDDPDKVLIGKSADECLRQLLSIVCPELLVTTIISPDRMGAAFFGYSLPTIQNLIQSSPGARRCVNYKWIKFEVSKTTASKDEISELSNAILNFDALQAKIK